MAAEVSRLLEQRLVMRESVVSQPSVSRLATRLRELREKQDQASCEAFQREAQLYQLEANKMCKVLGACALEAGEYTNLEGALLKEIASTEESIRALEAELESDKKLRKHREECEAVARDVHKLPSRVILDKQSQHIDNAISAADQAIVDMNDRITQRVSQFKALLEAIASLKGSLREEEEQLKLAMLQQQQAAAAAAAQMEEDTEQGEGGDYDDTGRGDGRGAAVDEPRGGDVDGEGEGEGEVEEEEGAVEEGEEMDVAA